MVGFPGDLSLENFENLEMLQCNLMHSEVHQQIINAGFRYFCGHSYQFFSRLTIDQKKELSYPGCVL